MILTRLPLAYITLTLYWVFLNKKINKSRYLRLLLVPSFSKNCMPTECFSHRCHLKTLLYQKLQVHQVWRRCRHSCCQVIPGEETYWILFFNRREHANLAGSYIWCESHKIILKTSFWLEFSDEEVLTFCGAPNRGSGPAIRKSNVLSKADRCMSSALQFRSQWYPNPST